MTVGPDGSGKPWGLGLAWIAGWLFTIGFLGYGFIEGAVALIFWPYLLGAALSGF